MKAMFYVIRFEPELDLGDIEYALKEIESPIRLEIGDKIKLSLDSFDRDPEDGIADINDVVRMRDILLAKSRHSSRYTATFEISDITYYHDYYDDSVINFHGVITLKDK